MSRKLFLDTDVILGYLIGRPTDQAAHAGALFEAARDGSVSLFVSDTVLVETAVVLWRTLGMERREVAHHLEALLEAPGVETYDKEAFGRALEFFEEYPVDLADAVLSSYAIAEGVAIASLDPVLDRIPGVIREGRQGD